MKRKIKWVAKKLYFATAIVIIAVALLLSIGRISAPFINDYKPNVEAYLSKELNLPVKIGDIQLSWYGFMPVLRLDNVAIFHRSHPEPTVEVQQFYVGVDLLQSLFSRYWHTGQLVISGTTLLFSQNETQRWQLHGVAKPLFDLDTLNQGESQIMSWLVQQHNVVLDQVNIKTVQPDGQEVAIAELHFSLRNTDKKRHVKGQIIFADSAKPQLQGILSLTKDEFQSNWNGKIYAKGTAIPLSTGLNAFLSKNLKAQGGITDLEIWGDIANSQLNELTGQFSIQDLILQPKGTKDKPWHLTQASAQLSSRVVAPKQREFMVSNLHLDINNNNWPEQTLLWKLDTSDPKQNKSEFKIDYVQLENVYPVAMSAELNALKPSGRLRDITLSLQHVKDQPVSFKARLNLDKVNSNPWEKIPGVKNLSGIVDFSNTQGKFSIASQSMIWTIPKVFRSPLIINSLQTDLTWEKKSQTLEINMPQLSATFPQQGKADLSMQLVIPDDKTQSPWVDIQGDISANHLSNQDVSGYLPVNIMPKGVVKWLDASLKSIGPSTAKFVMRGTVKDFPYDQGNGIFTINTTMSDVKLDYADGWPLVEHAAGDLLFSGRRMQANLTAGEVSGIKIKQAYAEIPRMGANTDVGLTVKGNGNGDLSQGFQFIQTSPLAKTVGQQLRDFKGSGPMTVNLDLALPLNQSSKSVPKRSPTLKGALTLQSATIELSQWHLFAKKINGDVEFTENSVFANDLTTMLMDWPTTISFKNQQQGNKDALQVQFAMSDQAEGIVNFATEDKGLRLTAGHIHFGPGKVSSPTKEGLIIDGEIALLDLTATHSPVAPHSSDELSEFFAMVQRVDLLIKELRLPSTTLTSLQIAGQPSAKGWEAQLQSQQLKGTLSYQSNREQPWWLTLQQLLLTPNATLTPSATVSASMAVQALPAFRFTCTNFQWGKKQLGEVAIISEKVPQGLKFKTLTAKSKETQFMATGSWLGDEKKQQSTIQGKITSLNTVETLKAWDLPSNIVSNNASLSFDLKWPGAIYQPNLTTLQGNIGILIKDGFVTGLSEETKTKMNLGRVLNLLSWQDLPKRLQLNFQDLTNKGYAFSELNGDYYLKNAVATTMNTEIDGSVADMQLVGEIGLVAQNYHLILTVIPNLTSSLPIVATLAAGPIVGAITWVVDTVLGSQVNKMSRYIYEVTGPWQDPKVEPITHAQARKLTKPK